MADKDEKMNFALYIDKAMHKYGKSPEKATKSPGVQFAKTLTDQYQDQYRSRVAMREARKAAVRQKFLATQKVI